MKTWTWVFFGLWNSNLTSSHHHMMMISKLNDHDTRTCCWPAVCLPLETEASRPKLRPGYNWVAWLRVVCYGGFRRASNSARIPCHPRHMMTLPSWPVQEVSDSDWMFSPSQWQVSIPIQEKWSRSPRVGSAPLNLSWKEPVYVIGLQVTNDSPSAVSKQNA